MLRNLNVPSDPVYSDLTIGEVDSAIYGSNDPYLISMSASYRGRVVLES